MSVVYEELFGKDAKILKSLETLRHVANEKKSILISGEIGTGKESLGQWVHQQSQRSEYKCLVVDCSKSIKLVENEILGHRDEENGRFHKGVLERGSGGTVILKNIETITDDFQKKIYRIIQELPDYDLDIRFITTTTKNLSKLVGAGRFHRALYLYLSDIQIYLPPLRDRKEDIEYIALRMLTLLAKEKNYPMPDLLNDALEKLSSHYWAHNLIELKSVLENSMSQNDDLSIGMNDLALGDKKTANFSFEGDDDGLRLMSLKDAERLLIRKALIYTSENRTQAAKILGVSIRTLRNKINEYRSDGSNYFVNLR